MITASPTSHDTGVIETDKYGHFHLRLTPGSAKEYLNRRQEFEKPLKPRYTLPLTFGILGVGLFGTAIITAISGSPWTLWGQPADAITAAGGVALAVLATITAVIAEMGASRARKAVATMSEDLGANVTLPLPFTLVPLSAGEDVITMAMNEVGPEVRDRLLTLVSNGQEESAEKAVLILIREAEKRWLRDYESKRQAVESAAREALGHRD